MKISTHRELVPLRYQIKILSYYTIHWGFKIYYHIIPYTGGAINAVIVWELFLIKV